ncbi:hypothetical protein [Psychrobacter ciconiae]|uniref:hypothetical protein n=1 Tax=Psychrobacter ciconiae TaxID=1553449 RepID=UPI00191ABB7B|nr:hypothetical protein [Psychrobacter ciconiae]
MIINRKAIITYTFLAMLASSAINANAAAPAQEKNMVLNQAKNYANSTACDTTFKKSPDTKLTTAKDVYLIDSEKQGKSDFGTKYLVFWGGDSGCSGGSGTYMYSLTLLSRERSNQRFTVRDDDILQNFDSINTRFVESVDFKNNAFTIISSNFAKDDLNNFPSNRYQYTIRYDKNLDNWRLTNTKFLGKNKY